MLTNAASSSASGLVPISSFLPETNSSCMLLFPDTLSADLLKFQTPYSEMAAYCLTFNVVYSSHVNLLSNENGEFFLSSEKNPSF